MAKTTDTGTARTVHGGLGELLGALLGDSSKEVRFKIVCKVVDRSSEPADDEVAPAARHGAQEIPRPLSAEGRINGIAALASFLGCAPSTIQRMKNDGLLPYYQRGIRVFFYEDEVLATMAQHPKKLGRAAVEGATERTPFATKFTPVIQ